MDYLINTAGEFITPIGFDFISKQSELTAVIFKEGKWGYINLQGETLISPQYNHAWPFSNELAFVKMGSKSAFIDKNNNIIIPYSNYEFRSFHEGVCAYKEKGKWGFINKNNETIVKAKYQDVWNFREGYAGVKKKNIMGFIDLTGNEISKSFHYELVDDFTEGLARVKKDNKFGFINQDFEEIIPCLYTSALNFSEGLAAVSVKNKWGFINAKNELVIDSLYDKTALAFSEGLCGVIIGNKMGFINKLGDLVIHYNYDEELIISECHILFKENRCAVKLIESNKHIYIDNKGTRIGEEFDITYGYSNKLGLVSSNNKFGFIDKNGEIKIDLKYSYATLFENEVTIVSVN